MTNEEASLEWARLYVDLIHRLDEGPIEPPLDIIKRVQEMVDKGQQGVPQAMPLLARLRDYIHYLIALEKQSKGSPYSAPTEVAMKPLTVTISGGEAWERDTLASEIHAALNSADIGCTLIVSLVSNDGEEHAEHLQHIARNHTVIIQRKP